MRVKFMRPLFDRFLLGFACSSVLGCTTMRDRQVLDHRDERIVYEMPSAQSGFDPFEARKMLEFCVDMDSQDDWYPEKGHGSRDGDPQSPYAPRIDNDEWETVVDSRVLVSLGKGPEVLYDQDRNGFSSFDNAWRLWRNKKQENLYVLAVRGTVPTSWESFKEDFLASSIAANDGIEVPKGRFLATKFAEMPGAELHAGFAYGAFTMLFDGKYGILSTLSKRHINIPSGSRIIITGHSQGAAIATLLHAFLHYAQKDGRFGLEDKNFLLKSYVFAQPKPGNDLFAMDFAGIAGTNNTSFVINNSLDPVPKVPLAIQTVNDVVSDMESVTWYAHLVDAIEVPLTAFGSLSHLQSRAR